MIGTTEPLSSIPGSSDGHVQLLTTGNFESISNFGTRALYIIISLIVYKNNITKNKLTLISSRVNYFKAARMIKNKKRAQQYFKHLMPVLFYLLVYGSWDCLDLWRSCFFLRFLHNVNYKSVNFFLVEMRFSLGPLCQTTRHDKYIFTLPSTHLKHQTDILRDKMSMGVAWPQLYFFLKKNSHHLIVGFL